jgi:predicted outer membrane protein
MRNTTTTTRRVAVGLAALLVAFFAVASARAAGYAAVAAAEAKPLPPAHRLERRFLQITAADLRFQSEASRLAAARSSNPAVKELAGTLLARQETSQPELLRLLHGRGMAMPIPTNEHSKILKQLGKLNGAKFDRLYVDEVVMRSYQADIANFEKMATLAEDPVLKGWVERQLPALRANLAKAGHALPGSAPLRGPRAM